MFWSDFTYNRVLAGTYTSIVSVLVKKTRYSVDVFDSNRPKRTLLAPSEPFNFTRISSNSKSVEIEAFLWSERVLMKHRHINAGQTSVKYEILVFCTMPFLCVWGMKHNVLMWDSCLKIQDEIKQGRKKTKDENRWVDEQCNGSHAKSISCRLNIFYLAHA